MNINLKIKFSSDLYSWLCFNHAVKEALEGNEISTDIDDFSSDYYMGDIFCKKCSEQYNKEYGESE